jgi:hypothetical protein
MLYIVSCKVKEMHYLSGTKLTDIVHAVEADDESSVRSKLQTLYDEKGVPYEDSYQIIAYNYINPLLK